MLKGKTVLITGGASGIGLATAQLMHANGARVAIAGREASKLELTRQKIGENVLAFQADVLSRKGLAAMASKVKEAFGGLDVFFANAGVAYVTPLATTTEDAYDTLMDTNVKSVFFSLQAIEPLLRDGASVILNTAWLNQVGVPGRAVLSASKAAVRSFARTFSAELLARRIRVNAVSPGLNRHTNPAWRWQVRVSWADRRPVHRSSRRSTEPFPLRPFKLLVTKPSGKGSAPGMVWRFSLENTFPF